VSVPEPRDETWSDPRWLRPDPAWSREDALEALNYYRLALSHAGEHGYDVQLRLELAEEELMAGYSFTCVCVGCRAHQSVEELHSSMLRKRAAGHL
jgi:hypothetical protein